MPEEHAAAQEVPAEPYAEATAPPVEAEIEHPELERRLAEPILKGDRGIDTAQVWVSAFVIVIAGVIAYSNAFRLPFRAEDQELILGNPGLLHFSDFNELVSAFPREPVAMLTLGLNAWLAPDLPVIFHMKNIGMHLLASVLVYLLARRLLRGRAPESVAMLAGLLFALHPLATEAVNFLVARGSLLAVIFSILSILLFLRATDDEARLRPWPFAGSLLCLVLAWGSRTAVIGLPVLVLAADWVVRGGRMTASRYAAHVGYWGATLILFAAHMAAFSTPPGAVEEPGVAFTVRLAALYQQLMWMVAPEGLSAIHAVPSPEAAHSQALIAGAVVLVFLIAALALLWKRSAAGFALLWCVVIQLGWAVMARPAFVSDEIHAYVPLAGLVLLLPWALQLVPPLGRLRTVAGVAAAVLLLAAGIGTFNRNQTWQSGLALWTDAVAKAPDSAEAHLRLGQAIMDDGLRALVEATSLATQKKPDDAAARQQAAVERFRAAEEQVRAALEREPDNARALFSLGELLEYQNRPGEAADAYRKVLALDPQHPDARWHLALMIEAQAAPGDLAALSRAVDLYRRADEGGHLPANLLPRYARSLSLLGAFDEAREALGRAGARAQGPAQEAIQAQMKEMGQALQAVNSVQQQLSAALQRDPRGAEALALRGQIMAISGHNLQAGYLLEGALKKNPQDGNAWLMLGLARARMGSAERFVQEFPVAPPSPNPATTPWRLLARAGAGDGYWDAARTYLEAASRAGELQGVAPAIAVADLAVELNQPQRAIEFLAQAAEASPTDPTPWLRLTDIAIARNDIPNAQAYYLKARERNAPPEELAKRKDKIGEVPEQRGPAVLR